MHFERSDLDDRAVLRAVGRSIIIGQGDVQLIGEVHKLISEGLVRVVLNLSQVNKIDSCGVGALVSCYTNLMNVGGELRLSQVHPGIQDMFEITAISKFLKSYPNDEEALTNFTP